MKNSVWGLLSALALAGTVVGADDPNLLTVKVGGTLNAETCNVRAIPSSDSMRVVKAEQGMHWTGLRNVVIEGEGRRLACGALRIADCVNVKVKGLSLESGGITLEHVDGLTFEGCTFTLEKECRVQDVFHSEPRAAVKNLCITGCKFDDLPFLVARLRSGDGVVFSNNMVCLAGRAGATGPWAGGFALENVKCFVAKGNTYSIRSGAPEPLIEYCRAYANETCVHGNVVKRRPSAGVDDLWEMYGSFGRVEGCAEYADGAYRLEREGYSVISTEETDGGVTHRRTVLKNTSCEPVTVTCLMDRFPLEEGDWEVYTQIGCWENESRGAWQSLHSSVEVRNSSLRSCQGVAPMIAAYNRQTGRGRVYHLLSDSAYELHVRRVHHAGNRSTVSVETGMDARQLAYRLAPDEEVALPEVVTYEFSNRLDLDCHKLHAWWNRHYPSRRPAALYNTWLYRFDKIDADALLKQVERAAAMGLEYFVIDAGWFGPAADWPSVRGEWKELPNGHLRGRMGEIAAAVRKAGMKFGFWVEAESVSDNCSIRKEHPDWIKPNDYYDFTNPAAFEYLVETICALLKKYDASFLKFDFNQNLEYDRTGRAFATYNAAYRRFVRVIRQRNPGIYIEGCASGGYMMDMGWGRDFDSFWLSDNQSPHEGLRIAKETMLRLAPRQVERWVVARTIAGVQPDYGGRDSRILATEDGLWTRASTYHPNYIDAFLAGGTPGFSCDLNAFSDEDFNHFRDYVSRFKTEAAFWQTAVGRILCDTGKVTVLEYSDEALRDVRVVVAAERVQQSSVRVYPVLDPAGVYMVNGAKRPATEIARDGIVVGVGDWEGANVRLTRVP